jgi:hypothetical protein
MRTLAIMLFVVGCGGGKAAAPGPAPVTKASEADPREVQLRTMTELLSGLADQVVAITEAQPASAQRCEQLTELVVAWGADHYEAYETADGEGSYLGLTADDADNAALRALAVELARDSSVLIEAVDEDCLYGSGDYGDALYEYLISYQGLEHWVHDGDPSVWDYETLIAERS